MLIRYMSGQIFATLDRKGTCEFCAKRTQKFSKNLSKINLWTTSFLYHILTVFLCMGIPRFNYKHS